MALVGGAALGAAFGKLFTVVIEGIETSVRFHSLLKKLKTTLERIKPFIQKTGRLNDELDRPRNEMEALIQILQKGEKLIQDCSRCNFFQIFWYAQKIERLDDSLLRFFQLDVAAQTNTKVTEILAILESEGLSRNKSEVSSCNAPGPPEHVVGLDVPVRELIRRLREDEESRIVVKAPGGYGKTTLAKQLCKDNQVKEYFKHILYATVSARPNLIPIVKKLFWPKVEEAPEFQNEEDAVNQIELELKKKAESGRILLVLDDVWCGSESLLAKLKFQIPEYKVLVTSRNEFPGFGSTYTLELLNEEHAMALFRKLAISEEGNCYFTPRDHLVKEIARHCKRIPLALEVVGRSLYGQPVKIWESRLKKLSEGPSILDSEADLRKCLQSSLDALNDEDVTLKECFMDLGSFPEDQKIPATALIDMWTELHELDKDGVHAIAGLHKLSSRSLLNFVVTRYGASEIDGCYSDAFVEQHDLLRDLAIYQSNQEPIKERKRLFVDLTADSKLPEWWTEEEQPRLSPRLVSISTGPLSPSFSMSHSGDLIHSIWYYFLNFSLPSLSMLKQLWYAFINFPSRVCQCVCRSSQTLRQGEMFSSSCGNLQIPETPETEVRWCSMQIPDPEVLILNFDQTQKKYKLPEFMKKMDKLKVLIVTNYGIAVELTNFPVLGSLSNLKRIRLEKVSIPTLCNTSMELKNLEKISFVMCYEIGQAFASATIQITKMLPNLREISIDYCNDLKELPEGFCDLVRLNKLSITNCHKLSALPEEIEKLKNLQLLWIRDCTSVSKLPDSIGSLQKLSFLDISGCVKMKGLPNRIGELRDLRDFHMRRCPGLCELPPSVENLVGLRSVICNDKHIAHLWESFEHLLPNLMLSVTEESASLNWLQR